jgi:hypothetical protein
MSPQDAYRCIDKEIEAYAFENALTIVLANPNNMSLFNKACDCITGKRDFNVSDLVKQFKNEFDKQKQQLTAGCKGKVGSGNKKGGS